jgi:hypothetical protein
MQCLRLAQRTTLLLGSEWLLAGKVFRAAHLWLGKSFVLRI